MTSPLRSTQRRRGRRKFKSCAVTENKRGKNLTVRLSMFLRKYISLN